MRASAAPERTRASGSASGFAGGADPKALPVQPPSPLLASGAVRRYRQLRASRAGMAVPTAGAMLEALAQRKARLEDELREVEKQVYNLETSYLNDSSTHGNVLKGFEGFLGPAKTQKCGRATRFRALCVFACVCAERARG